MASDWEDALGRDAEKSEIRNPKQRGNLEWENVGNKSAKRSDCGFCFLDFCFPIRICFGFRVSCFGFLHRQFHILPHPTPTVMCDYVGPTRYRCLPATFYRWF